MDKIDNWLGHRANGMLGMFLTGGTSADSAKNSTPVSDSARAAAGAQAPVSATGPAGVPKDTLLAGSNLRREITHQFQGAQHSFLRVLTSTFAITGAFMLVLFIAAYIGADPALYHGGILEMFPPRQRPRVALTLRRVSVVLRRWLVTQLIAMLVIGAVTTLFLVVLRVKAALPLGILAGIFKFIPIVGSIFAAVPAVAMAFIDSPHKALLVVIGYVTIQFIENHLLVPVLMKKGVNLPPAITLGAQALMSLLFGFLGLLVAVPLLAAVMAIARGVNADEMREVSAQADAEVGPDPDEGMVGDAVPESP
jgi:predicted PurR-regulated permease PerM